MLEILFGATALHYAAESSCVKTINKLLIKTVDINAIDTHAQTALHIAARGKNNLKTIRLLVKNGADINVKDENGNTPLDLATQAGNADIASFLVAQQEKFLKLSK